MPGNVDSVVLQLEARLGDYNQQVQGAANSTERALGRIGTATTGVDRGLARTRAGMQQLSFQLGDISQQWALGVRPMTIFAQQSGQVVQALQVMGGEGNKFLRFIGGPWGVALSAAAVVLLPLISNLFKAGDGVDQLVEKLQEHFRKTQENDRAQALFSKTIEGETQAIEENHKAVAGLSLVQETAAEKALRDAEALRQNTIQTRQNTIAKLEAAKAAVLREGGRPTGIYEGAGQTSRFTQAKAEADRLQAELDQANAALAKNKMDVIGARAGLIVEQANRTAEQKINDLYDKRIDSARNLAIEEGKVGAALTKQVEAINAARKAELDRLHTTSSRTSNAQSGRELSFAGARSIAESAGLRVTSAERSTASQARLYNDPSVNRPGNPVAKPGTSAHEGVQGKWALDIQFADGVTPALLRKVFGAQGVSLTKVLKEQGHYHIEGKRSEQDVTADKAAAVAQKQAEQEEKQYATALRRLDLERTLGELRGSGLADDARRADIMESDYQIESQFPELANSTNEADKARLETLKQIADAAINEEYARKAATESAKLTAELAKQIGDVADKQLKEMERAADQLHQRQEDQVRTLAGLYEDAFRGGTHAIWSDFKHIGLSVISEVLARFTIGNLLGGGKVSFGSALSSAIGHVLPGFGGGSGVKSGVGLFSPSSVAGFATGGSMVIGGRGGTDQNMLSLNDSPIARVSSGEVLNIANPRLAGAGSVNAPIVIEVHAVEGHMFETRVAGIADGRAVRVVQVAQPALTQAAVNETFRQSGRPKM